MNVKFNSKKIVQSSSSNIYLNVLEQIVTNISFFCKFVK